MNSPLVAFDKFEPAILAPERKRADVVPINPDIGRLRESLSASSAAVALGHFRSGTDFRDSKAIDYLIIAVLSILVHTTVVDYFKHSSVEKEELVEPVKIPSKVQISFVRPQPKPVVQHRRLRLRRKSLRLTSRLSPRCSQNPCPSWLSRLRFIAAPVQANAPVVSAPPAPPAPPVARKSNRAECRGRLFEQSDAGLS